MEYRITRDREHRNCIGLLFPRVTTLTRGVAVAVLKNLGNLMLSYLRGIVPYSSAFKFVVHGELFVCKFSLA